MDSHTICDNIQKFIGNPPGVDIGISDLSSLPSETRLGFTSAITVVVRLISGIIGEISDQPTISYFAHYRAVNRYIDDLTLKIGFFMESKGFNAHPIPASQSDPKAYYAGVFSHKTAAHLSGLGWIGKNALFIHNQWGSAVRLGTVLIDCDIETPKKIIPSRCGTCTRCKDICPAQAIEGINWTEDKKRKDLFDAHACSEYMKNHFQHIGRGSVCGLCIAVCPYTQCRQITSDKKEKVNI